MLHTKLHTVHYEIRKSEVVPSIKNYLFLFFGLRGSRIAAQLTFAPKRCNFIAPFSSSYPGIFTYLLYCFSFLWNSFKLSPRHRGRRGCPSYCFVGVWANYLGDETDLACQFSSSKPTKPLFGKSIIHYTWGSQFQRNPDPKKMIKYFILLFTITINSVLLFNYSNQQMSGSRNVLCIVLLFWKSTFKVDRTLVFSALLPLLWSLRRTRRRSSLLPSLQ